MQTVHALQQQISELQSQCEEREAKRQQLQARKEAIDHLETFANEGEIIRRRLHNTLQDLRGKLRVLARVRPILTSDKTKSQQPAVWKEGEDTVVVLHNGSEQRYTFDGAFGKESTQSEVFDEVSNFVQSALDGYNVCLFTYGQTGSGKTFTMQGLEEGEGLRGIIPRSIEKIMDDVERLREVGWEYSIQVSFVEIYCEQLRDLLRQDAGRRGVQENRMNYRGDDHTEPRLEVKLDKDGHPYIPNITRFPVQRKDHIHKLMEMASACRAVGVGIVIVNE